MFCLRPIKPQVIRRLHFLEFICLNFLRNQKFSCISYFTFNFADLFFNHLSFRNMLFQLSSITFLRFPYFLDEEHMFAKVVVVAHLRLLPVIGSSIHRNSYNKNNICYVPIRLMAKKQLHDYGYLVNGSN